MRLRDVKGKRIVAIDQRRFSNDGTMMTTVHALILEDGTQLIPITIETMVGAWYAHDFAVNRTNRTRKDKRQ